MIKHNNNQQKIIYVIAQNLITKNKKLHMSYKIINKTKEDKK